MDESSDDVAQQEQGRQPIMNSNENKESNDVKVNGEPVVVVIKEMAMIQKLLLR